MSPSVVVFDIGGVLVDWQPHLAWSDELGVDGAQAFMQRVDFLERNKRADNGERFSDMAAEIEDPEDRRRFHDYVVHYGKTVPEAIAGTWDIVDRLRSKGVAIHGITNWSAETWPAGIRAHPRLGEIFGTVVVSGQEGLSKPDARIYKLLCERAGVDPAACVFTDDGMHNIEGARAIGMDGIHFTGPDALEQGLTERGLL